MQEREYVVQPGETLTSIASKVLGPGSDWRTIAQLNHISDPKQVRAGQRLRLPNRSQAGVSQVAGRSIEAADRLTNSNGDTPATLPTHDYVAQSGETLRTIASKVLGPNGDWRILAELNHIADPLQIRPGQRIKIPVRVGHTLDGDSPSPLPTRAESPIAQLVHQDYVVQPGETLTSIASKLLGAGGDWRTIAQLNHISDPKQVRAGQRIKVPSRHGGE